VPSLAQIQGWKPGDDLLGFQQDGDDMADEAEDVFGSPPRLGSLTMPERASVETRYWSTTHSRAERLPRRVVGVEGDAAQGEKVVVTELGFVFGVDAHALDAEGDLGFVVLDLLQRIFGCFS
jgi:hypothetical protein